jgi:hypothetical protein
VEQRIKLEILGKDEFWNRAFHVEWEDQFPNRRLTPDGEVRFIAERDWLADLECVAAQTFCRVVCAPDNPQRRQWMNSLIARR